MNISDTTILNLYETQCLSIPEITSALDIPEALVLDVLARKSPRYKTAQKLDDTSVAIDDPANEDVPDAQFERIKQEAFYLALEHSNSEFVRASMIKFIWNKKRPETSININNINVTNINSAIERAREIRLQKLKIIDNE